MTLTYETAVKLKEAGWPQYGNNREVDGSLVMVGPKFGDRYDVDCYIPTIEELIEACGEDFFALMFTSEGWLAQASTFRGTSRNYVDYLTADTASEAVAALWLSLQYDKMKSDGQGGIQTHKGD